MALAPTYPGVYIDEVKSPVRTITGVPTATTAFVGPVTRGPAGKAKHLSNWGDFARAFGDLDATSLPLAYAVYQFYQNGGAEAEVVRIAASDAKPSAIDLGGGVIIDASSVGTWGDQLRARVDYATKDPSNQALWNLTVRDMATGQLERYLNIDVTAGSGAALDRVLASSGLVATNKKTNLTTRPPASPDPAAGQDPFAAPQVAAGGTGSGTGADGGGAGGEADGEGGSGDGAGGAGGGEGGGAGAGGGGAGAQVPYIQASGGSAGSTIAAKDYIGDPNQKSGMYALLDVDIFNLMIVSPATYGEDPPQGVLDEALKLCVDERAILLVDPPKSWTSIDTAFGGVASISLLGDNAKNAAVYFPRLSLTDRVLGGTRDFPPSGAVAGVITRTDGQRGVWKAPAGTDASISGVRGLTVPMTDQENGRLNPRAVNCIRSFPIIGSVIWGARTLRGADALADEWKYLPVRRLALYLEESLYRGTTWAVFEPNDEPLWSSLRLNIGAFMNSLWRQGAFQGATAREAYDVKCDRENNPDSDINRGIVNIHVSFAPLKPAEFVVIHIAQLAGQLET